MFFVFFAMLIMTGNMYFVSFVLALAIIIVRNFIRYKQGKFKVYQK